MKRKKREKKRRIMHITFSYCVFVWVWSCAVAFQVAILLSCRSGVHEIRQTFVHFLIAENIVYKIQKRNRNGNISDGKRKASVQSLSLFKMLVVVVVVFIVVVAVRFHNARERERDMRKRTSAHTGYNECELNPTRNSVMYPCTAYCDVLVPMVVVVVVVVDTQHAQNICPGIWRYIAQTTISSHSFFHFERSFISLFDSSSSSSS